MLAKLILQSMPNAVMLTKTTEPKLHIRYRRKYTNLLTDSMVRNESMLEFESVVLFKAFNFIK